MKKVLIIHNKYQNIGGEDIAVDEEIEILQKFYEVDTLIFENNLKNILSLGIGFFFSTNYRSNKLLKDKIENFLPDIAYVHNTWFKANLGIFKILQKNSIKTIVKFHNFRYHCTKSHLSNSHIEYGQICSGCGFEKNKRNFYNKYFDDSYLKSIFVNIYGRKYLQIIKKPIIHAIVLTKFHKKFMIKNNYKNTNLSTIPNFINAKLNRKDSEEKYIIYAGRVSKEKGVEQLIEAFLDSELKDFALKIVGDGPTLNNLKKKYINKRVQFLGELDNKIVLDLISSARAVVTCTKLFEGQPTLLCEASSMGVPSIFPDSGGIKEFFPDTYDLTFKQGDYQKLTSKLNKLNDLDFAYAEGDKCNNFYKKNFSEEVYLEKMKNLING